VKNLFKLWPLASLVVLAIVLIAWPTQPQTGTQHGVLLFFAPSTSAGVKSYNVYRWTGTGVPSAPLASNIATVPCPAITPPIPSSDLCYLDSTAQASTTYAYTVTALDGSGNESAASNQASISTPSSFPTNPLAPSGLGDAIK